ncbi:MAG: hypothetical protein ACK4NA_16630 [Alphaproteobacteria bacterium]
MDQQSEFEREGFAVYRAVVAQQALDLIRGEYDILLANERLRRGDAQVDNSYAAYGLPVSEALMGYLLPFMEEKTGYKLFPTYSYGRVYLNGATLTRHVDRPACEISLSLMIAESGGKPWPLYCETLSGKTVGVTLSPGDMMIYKGLDVPHWREPFAGERQLQVFLHYVRQDGPYAGQRYDGRPRLGAPPVPPAKPPTPPFAIFRDGKRP